MASLVLFASDLAKTSAFYESLGIALEPEQHDGGLPHAVGRIDGIHFAVHQAGVDVGSRAPQWRAAGSDFFGCYVDALDPVIEALTAAGARTLAAHQVRSWGCRVVMEDPDGRPVEINQRDHCPRNP